MALSKKSLQKKRERKRKNRNTIKKSINKLSNISYENWPIYECWAPKLLWDNGIGQVLVSRKNNLDEIVVGVYLLDVFCLGIKNCFIRKINMYDYHIFLEQVEEACGEMNLVDAIYANTLIQESLLYAKQIGFKPHPDFVNAKKILKNIDVDTKLQFNFGRDGKPCYIQGPHDSPKDIRRILSILERTLGSENHDFLIELPEEEFIFSIDEEMAENIIEHKEIIG